MGEAARYGGAASTALAASLRSRPGPGRVMGVSAGAAWLAAGGEVLVLCGPGSLRLPNAVVVGEGEPWKDLVSGDPVRVGGLQVRSADACVTVTRWWDPRPALPRSTAARIGEQAARCRPGPAGDEGLGRAMAAGDPLAARDLAVRLLGRGEGLTPMGDDVLAGALAAALLLGESAGREPFPAVAVLARAVLEAAPARTTALSASLLRCAAAGRVAQPVAGLLVALCGRGRIAPAREEVLRIGHSSGAGLLAGVLAGAAAVTGAAA